MRHNSRKQKTKWKDMNSTEHTKKKWVGCSFPQIVYQLHKLATNYPPLKDDGIILHPTFVFFFQHSTVDPDLCFFCLKNSKVFYMFLKHGVLAADMIHTLVLQHRKSTDNFKISEKKEKNRRADVH